MRWWRWRWGWRRWGGGATPLAYVGNSNPAVITATNAGAITANVVSNGDASDSVAASAVAGGPAASSTDGLIEIARSLHRSARNVAGHVAIPRAGRSATSAIQVNETVPCDSGNIHASGTVNDNGTGTVSVSYNACRTGTITASGSGTLRVDAYVFGFGITDSTLDFPRLTFSGSTVAEVSGTLRTRIDIPARRETVTENMVARMSSGVMTKSEAMEYVIVYDNLSFPTNYVESVSGRLFHSVHGWVDVSTTLPFFFASLSDDFAQNGQMTLTTGPGGPSIIVTAVSSTRLTLGLDLDGDAVLDITASLAWTELSGPVGADFGDTDTDGMPNGWETANAFDPNSSSDALTDADGDGASNRAEYLAGTNPRSASSAPASVGLSIQMTDAPDPAFVGGSVTYSLTVFNSGSVSANNVVVTDTLPAGADLVSASTGQGSCSGTTSVVCSLGTVMGFQSVGITIVVSPASPGVLSNTATVTTSSFDAVATDNTAIAVTTVGQPAAGLQGMIDTAAPGTTIVIDPGTYTGGLDFKGKNVTLRSRDGPGTTIIHGSGMTAVRMGPGGAIIGFTLTGGVAYWGGGIEVIGSGSLISRNILDGNVQHVGGGGAAISGNSASPTIERNIFRNNSCDNQYSAGVVAFFNMSSPRIVNNVFENNPCRAINLTMPEGTSPEIVNNTFVGNLTAIRIDRRVPHTTHVLRNNILVQNGIGLDLEFGSDNASYNPVWTNNLLFGNTTDYVGTTSLAGAPGNIVGNPLFVNQAAGNYDLQAGSPAIGAGSVLNAPTTDFEGLARGTSVDIGAFEGP